MGGLFGCGRMLSATARDSPFTGRGAFWGGGWRGAGQAADLLGVGCCQQQHGAALRQGDCAGLWWFSAGEGAEETCRVVRGSNCVLLFETLPPVCKLHISRLWQPHGYVSGAMCCYARPATSSCIRLCGIRRAVWGPHTPRSCLCQSTSALLYRTIRALPTPKCPLTLCLLLFSSSSPLPFPSLSSPSPSPPTHTHAKM